MKKVLAEIKESGFAWLAAAFLGMVVVLLVVETFSPGSGFAIVNEVVNRVMSF